MLASPILTTTLSPEVFRIWHQLPQAQRLGLGGIAAVAIVITAWFASQARSPEYGVAFANLRDEEAAPIVAKLKENKIPYEIADRGTIRVPAAQVPEVRLLVAAQGATPQSNSGFDFFSQPHFGMTEFAEKVSYQRALESELARSIGRIDPVDSARVHLVIPQASLFSSNQREPTASVVIQLKPSRRLDPTQVLGITGLVAGSVEGLKTQNISVLDTSGNVLTDRQLPGDPSYQTDRRIAVQRAFETRVEDDVRLILLRVLGPDRAVVRVGAELDWDQYEANTETFSPQNKPPQIRTQRETTESSQGAATVAGGIPGTASNLPGAGVESAERGPQTERREISSSYELSKTVERLTRAPGGIKRLSVAVALDSEALASPEQADAITKLVATAAGLDVNRGDIVTLSSLPFAPALGPTTGDVAGSARQGELMLTLARAAAMVIAPLIVLGTVWLTTRRRHGVPIHQIEAGAAGRAALAAPAPEALPRPRVEDLSTARLTKELGVFASSDPGTVAQIVRGWMIEDRGMG